MLRLELTKIRHELEEHLQAINETTNEIVANYEYLSVLESKLDRLSDRVNQMQMHLELNSDTVIAKRNNFEVKKLNRIEQKVFLVIYTLEEEKGSVTYEDIAQKLKISEQLVGNYVTSLIGKGVPIMKRYLNSKPFLRLDPVFKTLQTKENILQLSLQEFGF
ncbi:HTH domain-containing protein [Candidatus Woesearchaeota archaeon]|nr:HTH domain-containing protein [Candidatus Woesearchaeota archaeon]